MQIKLTNITCNLQQIMFIDGTGITVEPGKKELIDVLDIYFGELDRLKKFFKIEEIPVVKKEEPKTIKIEIGKEKIDGGNE